MTRRLFRSRARLEWRYEPGPGHELRQYLGGAPTGRVAITAWDCPDRTHLVGPDVFLIRDHTTLTVTEQPRHGLGSAVRLQVALASCRDAQLVDEPGLPGTAPIRFTLTVRLGRAAVDVPLWFSAGSRPFLQRLAAEIQAGAVVARKKRAAEVLTPLVVDTAPGSAEWIVFRASGDEDAVVPRWSGEVP
ncbi:hypothetical protein [Amycolatopsis sacchari]|uniref:Uncharacterized protein n=1 Tax=Amycolatopsis sacchari TaxID=115433 RepID=A0A1I3M0V9_9PSEU|nr:hypothetical protein [Amycolatopsis sacchari]SFI90603.1 hypothetical protein SAMN05421835_102130 [Amycolatopsis sacchari]